MKRASGIDGVFILGINSGSAAERAGLAAATRSIGGVVPGDVIVAPERQTRIALRGSIGEVGRLPGRPER